ncbi:MAG: hypothetical protein H0X34_14630 [Chthoniobacterales bacterium]|nr:hypothetical protein [Chthoniobacterales bacterium]
MESPASPTRLRYGPLANLFRRSGHLAWLVTEFVLLSALILGTRCANYEDVFVGGKVYFVDPDCYSRMTRARLVAEHPGLVVRHHDFENYPAGTNPHTTAPLDYLIVGLAALLTSLSAQPLDLAGALISPLLALVAGWFLWWWLRWMALRYRSAGLLLFALSPILAHGTALGRPDQQALLILLVLVALAAEWSLQEKASSAWSVVSGLSWGLALWVSLYEPLLLLAVLLGSPAGAARVQLLAHPRRIGWCVLAGVVLLAGLVERRWPQFPASELHSYFINWSVTIGELSVVSLTNPVWLQWFGGFIILVPFLLIPALRRKTLAPPFLALLVVTFALTLWQARWGYFLAIVFVLTIPAFLLVVRPGWLGGLLAALAFIPCLQSWDNEFWPNEQLQTRRAEARLEAAEWRAVVAALPPDRRAPFLAPWWLSPSAAYWSGRRGLAGSSHESLPGIVESARFYQSIEPNDARAILQRHGVQWVMVYDAERVAQNSAAILGAPAPPRSLGLILDRTPSQAPPFLSLVAQNRACKLYEARLGKENPAFQDPNR